MKQKVKSQLRITKYIFGLKLRESIIMKTIDPLNLMRGFFFLASEPSMILGSLHGIWRCWVCFEFRLMQIVVIISSSMKPLQ